MSFELMIKVMSIRVGHSGQKLVLIALANRADERGRCWPSYQTVADDCEISRVSVMRHIKSLESCGLLLVKKRRLAASVSMTNIFELRLDQRDDLAAEAVTGCDSPPSQIVIPLEEQNATGEVAAKAVIGCDPLMDSVAVEQSGVTPCHSVVSQRDYPGHTVTPKSVIESVKRLKDKDSVAFDNGVVVCDEDVILGLLNTVTGRKFKTAPGLKTILTFYTVDDVCSVIEYKAKEWMGDNRMQVYLRPKTLFNMGNFEGYINNINQLIPPANRGGGGQKNPRFDDKNKASNRGDDFIKRNFYSSWADGL